MIEALDNYQRDLDSTQTLISNLEVSDKPVLRDTGTSCVHMLQNLTNYFLANNETVERILRNSGKDYNDLGRYYDCLNTTGFRYILASVPHALPIGISVGMCIPEVCTV